ncbi:MAG: phage holin family protein [Verrucomicrobiota bacterium]
MNSSENNFADLLKQLRDDTTTLVKEEIALAKTEIAETAAKLSRHALMMAVGALVAHVALILILVAVAFLAAMMLRSMGVSADMSTFFAFLTVAVLSAAAGTALLLNGLNGFKKEKLIPRKTIRSLKDDKQFIKNNLP